MLISDLGKRRFISYRDFESVNRFAEIEGNKRRDRNVGQLGVVLHLKDDEHVLLPMTRDRLKSRDDLIGAYEQISDARASWQLARPDEVGGALERSGRKTQEWMTSLRALGNSNEAYRVAAIDREKLFAIVEGPANEAVSRAAAAIALGAKLKGADRTRLKTATEAVAEPHLRIAIQHVISNKNDDDLEAALDELDALEKVVR